jgi:hypothetical protein
MGLLDDAIREHLDLKRRHGADPADVARMEQEALGPVRREPATAAGSAADNAAADDAEQAPVTAAGEPQLDEPRLAEEPHPAEDHTHVLSADERHEGAHGDPLSEHAPGEADRVQDPPAHAEAEDPRHDDIVHQPTTEFRVEDHHDDEDQEAVDNPPQPAAEDVLEETPEFLQETPEHDRLWFEQRPPRDFDFDG